MNQLLLNNAVPLWKTALLTTNCIVILYQNSELSINYLEIFFAPFPRIKAEFSPIPTDKMWWPTRMTFSPGSLFIPNGLRHKSFRANRAFPVAQPIQRAARLFQGIRASSNPIPQKSVMPAKTNPAPTNADRPKKPRCTNQPSTTPMNTSEPAAIRT